MRLDVPEKIMREVETADRRYGDFTSSHEGYGVLAEEVAELLEVIRLNDAESIIDEACQCAAVATRLAASMLNEATRERSGCAS